MNYTFVATTIVGIATCIGLVLLLVLMKDFTKNLESYQDAPNAPLSLHALHLPKVDPNWQGASIPKIIHQMAPKDKDRWHVLWEQCQKTWKEKFPDFEYRMWHDEDIDEFFKTRYPSFYETFKGYEYNIQRIDIARYFILYEFGGIYADMDYEAVNNFYDVLPVGKVSIGTPTNDDEFHNALMISPPRHPFWHYVIAEAIAYKDWRHDSTNDRVKKHLSIAHTTGPFLIVRAVQISPENMVYSLPNDKFSVATENAYEEGWTTLFDHKDRESIYAYNYGTVTWIE